MERATQGNRYRQLLRKEPQPSLRCTADGFLGQGPGLHKRPHGRRKEHRRDFHVCQVACACGIAPVGRAARKHLRRIPEHGRALPAGKSPESKQDPPNRGLRRRIPLHDQLFARRTGPPSGCPYNKFRRRAEGFQHCRQGDRPRRHPDHDYPCVKGA